MAAGENASHVIDTTPGWVIERTDQGMPMYFSPKAGRDAGAGGNGWIAEARGGLRFARQRDAVEFRDTYLQPLSPYCRAIQVSW